MNVWLFDPDKVSGVTGKQHLYLAFSQKLIKAPRHHNEH